MNSLIVVEMLGEANAIKCAENYRTLRKRGVTIRKMIDVFIATYCIENKCPLLFQDKDFLPFVERMGLLPAIKSASYGRNASYPAPPARTRTCSFPASGSSVVLAFASNKIITQIPYAVALIR